MDLLSLGKDPISEDQPTGSDVRYEPEFDELQAEIDKLSVPSASGELDWNKVSDLSATILREKSKDLLVASYLAVSQLYINKVEGLSTGLQVIYDMVNQYWDNLFPAKKRMRGRIASLEWWVEKTEKAGEQIELEPVSGELLETINTTLSKIDSLLIENLEDPPLLRPIQRVIETIPSEDEAAIPAEEPPQEKTTEEEKSEPPPRPEKKKEPEKPAPVRPVTPPVMEITGEEDPKKVINSWVQTARQMAAVFLEKDPTNPAAYRYRRIAAWSGVNVLPSASDGKTQIPPPAPQVRQPLEDLRNSGNHNALIVSVEQNFSKFIFWFDLNRWVAESLKNLGDNYEKAHDVVCQETAFLLYRLPGLEELMFSDGTPLADPETKQWLNSIQFGSSAAPAVQVSVVDTAPTEDKKNPIAETTKKALALAKKKKLKQAVQLIQEQLKNSSSKKDALLWRQALCEILISSKRSDMALPHLEIILKDIDAYQLSTWDPDLALRSLILIWAGFKSIEELQTTSAPEEILSRIAELDPVEALALAK